MDADFKAKFCNVVPIRYGLITWAFMKVCAAFGAIAYILLGIYTMLIQHDIPPNLIMLGIMVTLDIALMLDLYMSMIFIVGEYKKNYKLITTYFRYAIYAVITAILVISLYTTYELALLWAEVDNAPWRDFRTFDLPDVVKLATIGTVADVLAISYLMLVISILYSYKLGGFFRPLSIFHILVLVVIALIVDVGFLIVLIGGIFKKSLAILRVFYFYEFYAMTAETVLIVINCVNLMDVDTAQGTVHVMVGVLYILLDLCIIVTVKSEMIKLRNKEQYDFSRMPICEADVEGTGKFNVEGE